MGRRPLWDTWQQQSFDTFRALLVIGRIQKKPLSTSIPIFKQEATNEKIIQFAPQVGNIKHI